MSNKKILEILTNNPFYQNVLQGVGEEERKKISEVIEPMFIDMIAPIQQIMDKMSEDPKYAMEVSDLFKKQTNENSKKQEKLEHAFARSSNTKKESST